MKIGLGNGRSQKLCCLWKEVTAMSHNNNYEGIEKKVMALGMALGFLVFFIFFTLQYWKPDFYWNSPNIKSLRSKYGEHGLDILINAIVAMDVLGKITDCFSKKQ